MALSHGDVYQEDGARMGTGIFYRFPEGAALEGKFLMTDTRWKIDPKLTPPGHVFVLVPSYGDRTPIRCELDTLRDGLGLDQPREVASLRALAHARGAVAP
jgi:hypothetical protein